MLSICKLTLAKHAAEHLGQAQKFEVFFPADKL
jgi:hypothetical protein